MKVSFDGLRKNIAQAYNDHARFIKSMETVSSYEMEQLKKTCGELRWFIDALMMCRDENCPDDCNDLSESVKLISTIQDGE